MSSEHDRLAQHLVRMGDVRNALIRLAIDVPTPENVAAAHRALDTESRLYGLELTSLRTRQIKGLILDGHVKAVSFGYQSAPPQTRTQRVWRAVKFQTANVFSIYWGQLWVPLAWRAVQVLAGVVFIVGVARWTRGR